MWRLTHRIREQARSHICVVFQQVMQLHKLQRQLVPWVQVDQRLALLVLLAHAHRAGQVYRQYRQAFGNQLIKQTLSSGPFSKKNQVDIYETPFDNLHVITATAECTGRFGRDPGGPRP